MCALTCAINTSIVKNPVWYEQGTVCRHLNAQYNHCRDKGAFINIARSIRSSITRTLVFGVGVFADNRREGEARMGKNRSRTFSRWHPVGTIVRRTSGAASGEEAAILAASISSRAKRGTRVSKHVWYSWWRYFLRLGHGFGRPAHTANCNTCK